MNNAAPTIQRGVGPCRGILKPGPTRDQSEAKWIAGSKSDLLTFGHYKRESKVIACCYLHSP